MNQTLEAPGQTQEKSPAMNFVLIDTPGTEQACGVFAHHHAEELCDRNNKPGEDFVAPDFVALAGGMPDLVDGIYRCTVYDVPATLFFWTRNGVPRGLVTLNTDAEGTDFARAKFTKRLLSL